MPHGEQPAWLLLRNMLLQLAVNIASLITALWGKFAKNAQ